MFKFLLPPLLFAVAAICQLSAAAPDDNDLPVPIPVGKGSYASRPPRDQAARPGVKGKEGWGDLSQVFTHMKLWVPENYHGPVPSTDWWTTLVSRPWSGQLWSYPAMVKAQPDGIAIAFPKTWKLADNAKKMILEPASHLLVRGKGFVPESKFAETWSDWLVTFREQQSPQSWMKVTIGHGLPCTWIETSGVDLRIDVEKAIFFAVNGAPQTLPLAGTVIGVESNGDCYGIYAPAGTRFSLDGASLVIQFAGAQKWISVALLPTRRELAFYTKYAPVVPRSTKVAWDYSPEKGELATTWTLQTENLAGAPDLDVVQGWIPHHYDTAHGVRPEFAFNNLTYATPRGVMKCAVGRTFKITYPFRGLLPELPAPAVASGQPNPYRPDVMKALIDGHSDETGYGSETYWGGKKILLFAKYMEMAYQLGLKEEASLYQARLREALVDWATYKPGEKEHFFALYPNWGSMVGFRTRDNQNPGIDVLQDHAFCYGYHVYAAALLAIHDPEFARDYGEMATLMVKDYANWDPQDTRFCTFRSMDPWCGHSWSGGMGSETGNGQESSSETMQAWGAMFTLGSVLDNRAMRDAAVFGYVSESRAVAEYWFDRDKKNIPRDVWPHAYNGNQETNGVGWWTWFSGDEFWMHAIQWLPMSPLLKYLAEDPAFAKWDYESMMKDKRIGGYESNLGNESGVGNVALSYLQLFDPDQAAAVFDQLWDANRKTAHAKDEPGPTYYRIHAGRALGTIRWDAWTDIPTSTVYKNAAGKTVVAVYNTSAQEETCHLYENGKNTATFQVPARRLIAWTADNKTPLPPLETTLAVGKAPSPTPPPSGPAALTRIEVDPADALMSDHATQKFTAKGFDQYGKPFAITPTWSVQGKGNIDATGLYTPNGGGNFEFPHFDIVAAARGVTGTAWAAVEESRRVAKIELVPEPPRELKMAVGTMMRFRAAATDQFNAPYVLPLAWSATGSVQVSPDGRVSAGKAGDGSFTAEAGGQRITVPVKIVPLDQINLAANKPATASSVENDKSDASSAVDGNDRTRWSSTYSDPQWISVDLEASYALRKIVLNWQNAAAKMYEIELSADGTHWTSVAKVTDGKPGVRDFDANGARGRYLRITGTQRTTGYGYSLYEIEAYGTP